MSQADPMRVENRLLPVLLNAGRQSDGHAAVKGGRPTAPFAAQLLGQAYSCRGVKGGPQGPGDARAAYLRSEYLGEGDRRLPPGIFRRTKV